MQPHGGEEDVLELLNVFQHTQQLDAAGSNTSTGPHMANTSIANATGSSECISNSNATDVARLRQGGLADTDARGTQLQPVHAAPAGRPTLDTHRCGQGCVGVAGPVAALPPALFDFAAAQPDSADSHYLRVQHQTSGQGVGATGSGQVLSMMQQEAAAMVSGLASSGSGGGLELRRPASGAARAWGNGRQSAVNAASAPAARLQPRSSGVACAAATMKNVRAASLQRKRSTDPCTAKGSQRALTALARTSTCQRALQDGACDSQAQVGDTGMVADASTW